MSSLLEKIIVSSVDVSSFPKAAVEIYIFVLEVDGGRPLSSCVNQILFVWLQCALHLL